MSIATLRRLPGFAFETETPVYDDVLPRMDVALFVGFAASGPVDVPVPVEDRAQFEALFGADAPLAWDAEAGELTRGQLAPAVRAFFANGGTRCWIVRVAREPRSNQFQVPGVAVSDGRIIPFTMTSRSPGSWADALSVSASLTAKRMALARWESPSEPLWLSARSGAELQTGDLLRITWSDAAVQAYIAVAAVTPIDEIRGARYLVVEPGVARWFDLTRHPAQRHGTAVLKSRTVDAEFLPPDSPPAPSDAATIALGITPLDAPRPGTVLVSSFGSDTLVLTVDQAAVIAGDDTARPVHVSGRALWPRTSPYVWPTHDSPPLPPRVVVECLGLDLWARTPSGDPLRFGDAGLAPGHPRHLSLVPDDHTVFGVRDWPDATLWADAITPRFPLAGSLQPCNAVAEPPATPLCIPFGVRALPDRYLPPIVADGDPIVRDGLSAFDAALFADEGVAGSPTTTLIADAEYQRFLSPVPRPVAGLHAALPIEEVTLIAVPDAVQTGWRLDATYPPELTTFDAKPPCDDTGRFAACTALACPPVLTATATAEAVTLAWTAFDHRGAFVVEQASDSSFSDAAIAYEGSAHTATMAGLTPGDHFYRVHGVGDRPTEWSNGVAARVPATGGWRMTPASAYQEDTLIAIHRMLLRVCGARRDVMAVLSLPQHYRDDAAIAHARLLASPTAPALDVGRALVAPIGHGESDALSFAALYHGWTFTRDDSGALRAVAPGGPACGVIARRSLARGAWIAPANELLNDVVALDHPVPTSRWQELQQFRVNVVRQGAHGFVIMSADTLALDDDVRPIGVRRLLILLRRLALLRGAGYVFEPNDDAFQRMVQRGFEETLGTLFERGAFAGSTAATAFQVVTDATLNTPPSIDQGRFIVELRVAPSRPMTFLTLRLVQTGDRVAVVGA